MIKNFLLNFVNILYQKEFSYFSLGLTFISDIDTFIGIMNETKEKIYKNYFKKIIVKKALNQ